MVGVTIVNTQKSRLSRRHSQRHVDDHGAESRKNCCTAPTSPCRMAREQAHVTF